MFSICCQSENYSFKISINFLLLTHFAIVFWQVDYGRHFSALLSGTEALLERCYRDALRGQRASAGPLVAKPPQQRAEELCTRSADLKHRRREGKQSSHKK